jgi:hypothetical protein
MIRLRKMMREHSSELGPILALLGHAGDEASGHAGLLPSKPVAEGGLSFRARFGVERNGAAAKSSSRRHRPAASVRAGERHRSSKFWWRPDRPLD